LTNSDLLLLQRIAQSAMREHGLEPDFSPAALAELKNLPASVNSAAPSGELRDLRSLIWCSIDNDDSRDLDQLTVAAPLPDDGVRLYLAIADVDALVHKGSAIDDHAQQNTTSVYTPGAMFPMLPEKLSTDLTSLGPQVDRAAIVADMSFDRAGILTKWELYRAVVRNQAKLAYNSMSDWLDGKGPLPAPAEAVPGLADNIRLQDHLAQQLRLRRHKHGALNLETIKAQPVFEGSMLRDLTPERQNRAQQLIEDIMIVGNFAAAQFLADRKLPSIRRVLQKPEHWDLLIKLASAHGGQLPKEPDAVALENFLMKAKAKDPVGFPDLSLAVIKLLGSGEYLVDYPGASVPGHFGLAVDTYSHSTAPNRRFPDLITQRLLKAAMAKQPSPYKPAELDALAQRCSEMEDAAKKVERQLTKSAAALLMRNRIGEIFNGIVTGASEKGTWVRVLGGPPVEGKLMANAAGLHVGDRTRFRLTGTNVERGFIDFELA
jgi:VacB/RNase II family 3'-5' exoribonuclease